MGRELTRRYASLFDKKGLKDVVHFVNDLFQHRKWIELVSFMVWEFLHQSRLFPKSKYLKFNDGETLTLEKEELNTTAFREKITRLFANRGLSILSSNHGWKLLFIKNNGEILGCVYPDDKKLYKSIDNGGSVTLVQEFPEAIKSIYVSSRNTIFVCVKGAVYKSSDNGEAFRKALDLSTSESYFRHNNGMTEAADKTLIIGEYGNVWGGRAWKQVAFLYFSADDGGKWIRSDFLLKKGINKHVHAVRYSGLLDRILVSDGDNKKKLWMSDRLERFDFKNPEWKAVNKFHIQMGGYTSIVESDDKVLFGTDYQGGTNFVVESGDGRNFNKRVIPDPYRRSPIDNMVCRKSSRGNEIWANLPYSTVGTKSLLMYTANGGRSWNKVIEYSRSTHKVWLLSSSNNGTDALYFSIEDLKNNDRIVLLIQPE